MRKKLIILGILLFMLSMGTFITSVNAHNIRAEYWYNPGAAKTTTKSDWELNPNNYLYAETIGWSVGTSGKETFHQGPKNKKQHATSVSSQINVPWGRGTWFECHYEGHCNRCGEVLARDKKMFAF